VPVEHVPGLRAAGAELQRDVGGAEARFGQGDHDVASAAAAVVRSAATVAVAVGVRGLARRELELVQRREQHRHGDEMTARQPAGDRLGIAGRAVREPAQPPRLRGRRRHVGVQLLEAVDSAQKVRVVPGDPAIDLGLELVAAAVDGRDQLLCAAGARPVPADLTAQRVHGERARRKRQLERGRRDRRHDQRLNAAAGAFAPGDVGPLASDASAPMPGIPCGDGRSAWRGDGAIEPLPGRLPDPGVCFRGSGSRVRQRRARHRPRPDRR
jgi:hypothetical protein